MMWGGELLKRDGVPCGQVTSAAWSLTAQACVGLAYVWDPHGGALDPKTLTHGSWSVNIGGMEVGTQVSLKPWYDPANERIRQP